MGWIIGGIGRAEREGEWWWSVSPKECGLFTWPFGA